MGPDPPGGAVPDNILAQGRAMSRQEVVEAEGGGGGVNILRWWQRCRRHAWRKSGST